MLKRNQIRTRVNGQVQFEYSMFEGVLPNSQTAKQKNSETAFFKIIIFFSKDKTSEQHYRVNTILHAASISLKLVYFSDRFCQYCGFVSIREHKYFESTLFIFITNTD